jgi:hypothetical protein
MPDSTVLSQREDTPRERQKKGGLKALCKLQKKLIFFAEKNIT